MVKVKTPSASKSCNVCGRRVIAKRFKYFIHEYKTEDVEYVPICKRCERFFNSLDFELIRSLAEIREMLSKTMKVKEVRKVMKSIKQLYNIERDVPEKLLKQITKKFFSTKALWKIEPIKTREEALEYKEYLDFLQEYGSLAK